MNPEYRLEGDLFDLESYNEEQRKKYRIFIWRGRFYDSNGNLIGAKGSVSLDYVMSSDGRLYSGKPIHNERHHSSYLAGAEVAGAGQWTIENGIILYIDRKSGHYLPTYELFNQVLARLSELGAITNQLKISISY